MAVLHLMVGLPCSGKTTRARLLEEQHDALRLTPDEWHVTLFGQDADDPEHDQRHEAVERLMWQVASRALARGLDVILDFGFWSAAERCDFRDRAAALGATAVIHYADVPPAELLARLERRNAALPPLTFAIAVSDMVRWIARFEPPTADELAG